MRHVTAAAVVALALTACSSSEPTAAPRQRRPASHPPRTLDAIAGPRSPLPTGPPTPARPRRGATLATATAVTRDPFPDATKQGQVPPFADVTWGAVQGDGSQVRLRLGLRGDLPQRMPDPATTVLVSWNIAGDRTHDTMGFTAQANEQGWSVQAGGNDGTVPYPGTVTVVGNQIELSFPWSFLGGAHRFTWSAAFSWYSSKDGAQSSASDNIPKGRYP